MDSLFLIFLALLAVSALLASIAIWAPRPVWIRATSVLAAASFFPLAYLGLTEILSQPKPMAHEWFKRHVDEATVLGVSVKEGEAIYLWLRLDDSLEPRYYVLPWRRELAEKLQNLIDEAIRENGTLKLQNPFPRKSYDDLGEYNFEIILPPQPPMKAPPPPPGFYVPRERSA